MPKNNEKFNEKIESKTKSYNDNQETRQCCLSNMFLSELTTWTERVRIGEKEIKASKLGEAKREEGGRWRIERGKRKRMK